VIFFFYGEIFAKKDSCEISGDRIYHPHVSGHKREGATVRIRIPIAKA